MVMIFSVSIWLKWRRGAEKPILAIIKSIFEKLMSHQHLGLATQFSQLTRVNSTAHYYTDRATVAVSGDCRPM